jgi:hypothetical protein
MTPAPPAPSRLIELLGVKFDGLRLLLLSSVWLF